MPLALVSTYVCMHVFVRWYVCGTTLLLGVPCSYGCLFVLTFFKSNRGFFLSCGLVRNNGSLFALQRWMFGIFAGLLVGYSLCGS